MSKVNAFRCDYCNTIKETEHFYGIHLSEDLFDQNNSYPIEYNKPEKCHIHFCVECYHNKVTEPAKAQTHHTIALHRAKIRRAEAANLQPPDPINMETVKNLHLQEYSYMFRSNVVLNAKKLQ